MALSMRWAVPGGVAVVIAGSVSGVALIGADADPSLPPKTAAELLVDIGNADVDGLSGTVVQKADLGLPEIPVPSGGQGSADLTSMLSGSHTLRVWYGGPEQQRVALLGTLGESDVIHNGTDLWSWNSDKNTATHVALPEGTDQPHRAMPGMTPEEAATAALDAIDPTTRVSANGTASVAGRSAYELVLEPRDDASLIGQIRLAVDSETGMPLRVRVLADGHTDPAIEIGYTQITFAEPDQRQFDFTPPPGATVTEADPFTERPDGLTVADLGDGWTTVLVVSGMTGGDGEESELTSMLGSLPRVSGEWGSGRLFTSDLVTALLTDDGRMIVGAVGEDVIFQAASR